MSGVITAAIVLGVGASIYSAEKSAAGQDKALRQQRLAQDQAQRDAIAQRRRSATALNAANRRQPDVSGILGRAAAAATDGAGGTMLTGPGGVPGGELTLGRPTLLGG